MGFCRLVYRANLLAFLALVSAGAAQAGSDSGPLVSLKQGRYRGNFVMTSNLAHVAEYLGIPYARPPIHKLRFANPESLDLEPGRTFDAKSYAPACPQGMDNKFGKFRGSTMWNPPGGIMSESCLFLNVWVPQTSTAELKTVMVWIHGGGFYSGSTNLEMYDGSTLAAHGDVIVVSIAYRLGVLGFLSTGDDKIPGNFGMMDQVFALKWINENIEQFGGDPSSVTLFGESAGGIAVSLHLLSPLSNGLFRRAIIQSPARLSNYVLDRREARRRAERLMGKVTCRNDEQALECLRKINPRLFIRAQEYAMLRKTDAFLPTISNFMPRSPEDILRSGEFEKRDIIAGINKDEGSFFLIYSSKSFSLYKNSEQTRENMKNAFKYLLERFSPAEREEIYDLYTKDISKDDGIGNRDAMDDLLGDYVFICPTQNIVKWSTDAGSDSYLYYYSYRDSQEVWPDWMGVIHGAEINFVFGRPLNTTLGYLETEKKFSSRIMSYWTNFAKTGNPNNRGNSPWPEYTTDRKEYLELSPREKTLEGGHRQTTCRLWDELTNAGSLNTRTILQMLIVASLTILARFL